MESEFVPYEIALALKELGFDEECFGFYNNADKIVWIKHTIDVSIDGIYTGDFEAPLYQQVFRWFREKYGLQSYINPELSFSYNNPKYNVVFIKTIKNFTTHKDDTIWIKEGVQRKRFDIYEEAQLACLNKLIEILKNNK